MHLVLFDLESTGFSPQADEILQIAAARADAGRSDSGRVLQHVCPVHSPRSGRTLDRPVSE